MCMESTGTNSGDSKACRGSVRASGSGFTLLECLLSLVILTLIASVVGSVYYTGLQTYSIQGDTIQLDSALRSRMEFLLSLNFDQLSSGSDNVTVSGQSYTATWTVSNTDLDGDGAAELTAKKIVLTLAGRTLATVVADTTGKTFKL